MVEEKEADFLRKDTQRIQRKLKLIVSNWCKLTTTRLKLMSTLKYYAVDCFGGSGSFARAIVDIMRLRSVIVQVLLLDFVAETIARKHYPELIPYLDEGTIIYYRTDLSQLEDVVFATLIAYFMDGQVIERMSWIHASVDCTTFSWAGMTSVNHRTVEGASISTLAVSHSKMLRLMVKLAEWYVRVNPTGLFTFESPAHGSFKSQAEIQNLLAQEGWMLFLTNYCAAACPTLDGPVHEQEGKLLGAVWPCKSTVIVAFGLGDAGSLPTCDGEGCRMMVPGSKHHAKVICSSSEGYKTNQSKVPALQKAQIPKGLFQAILDKHEDHSNQCDGSAFYCFKCGEGGDMLICDTDGCKRVQHADCEGLMPKEMEGEWYCDICVMRYQLGLDME